MGGTKKRKYERGMATAFISRNKALRKLQLNLADFRALCIFKGIYPVEPPKRKKVNKGSTFLKTYYNLKDIQFLSHDQLITKFREKKHYIRRLKKAIAKQNSDDESVIRDNKPVYSLKSVIRERYPTFTDALRDLDDCLNLCFVFATFPISRHIHSDFIQLCKKRTVEFLHYVMAAKALRKVFVSIKGIYYQADVKGETISWVVPHKRGYTHPQDVDYKVMQTFSEYYSVLLGHINIKLYNEKSLVYPPQLAESPPICYLNHCQDDDTVDENLASLAPAIRTYGDAQEEYEDDPEVDAMNAVNEDDPDIVEKTKLEAQNVQKVQNLFKGLKFFLNREVPKEDLTFVIRSCGGLVSWDISLGPGATFMETEDIVTHHIIDRPKVANQRITRTYVQPQWVFDCINARTVLPAQDYFPGVPCPAHLSPFVKAGEGQYVPEEMVKFLKRSKGDYVEESDNEDGGQDSSDDDEIVDSENEEDKEEEEPVKKGKKRKADDDDEVEESSSKTSKVSKMSVTAGQVEKVDKEKILARQQAEEKRLGEMMIPKKHKRLYHKIRHSEKKSSQEAQKLQQKKDKLLEVKKEQKKMKRKSS